MLKQRIITALVLLVLTMFDLFLAGQGLFALTIGLLCAAAAWEWGRLAGIGTDGAEVAYASAVGVLVLVSLFLPLSSLAIGVGLALGLLFWVSVPLLFRVRPVHPPIDRMSPALLIIGACLLVIAGLSIQYLRSVAPHASPALLLYALSVVWLMDIGAYFSGRRFGRRKLSPSISPGKTWEGVWGGLAVTMLAMLLVIVLMDLPEGFGWRLVVASLPAAALSVVGDLYESRMKRAAGRKDSSQLLPGHGGVLDRIDGVVAATPVFAAVWAALWAWV